MNPQNFNFYNGPLLGAQKKKLKKLRTTKPIFLTYFFDGQSFIDKKSDDK